LHDLRLLNHFSVSITTKEISGGYLITLPSFPKMMLEVEANLDLHHCLLKSVEVRTTTSRY
jgi:small neutral amino acid transporter SnatA (MarC family)